MANPDEIFKQKVKLMDYTWSVQDVKQLYENKVSVRSPIILTKLSAGYSGWTPKAKWRLLMTTTVEQDEKEKRKYQQNSEETLQSSSPAKRRKYQERVESKQYISVYLQCVTKHFYPQSILKLTFSILSPFDGTIFSKSKNILKVIRGQHCGFSDFISIDELDKMKLQDLIIRCYFTEVKEDFKKSEILLNNKMFSDIELHISDQIIPAHKVVLALSIPFFRKKFAEQDSMTFIEIHDTEIEIFKEMLSHAYTGKVNHVNSDATCKLYLACVKYGISDLRKSCLKIMEACLTGEELIRILLDSLKKKDCCSDLEDLRKLCAKYIARNQRIVLKDYFKDFAQWGPSFLVLTLMYVSQGKYTAKWAIKIMSDTLAMSDPPLTTQYSLKHFGIYLNNQTLSDVEIQFDDKKYFAHRVILTSRSLFFNRLFSHNMSKTISAVVKIEDIDSQVFYEVLRFMYTNEFENRDDTVEEILIAANKYEVYDLKSICEQILKKKVNVENCLRVVQFADAHNAEELKKFCLYYVITNLCLPRIPYYSALYDFSETHPHLILEMLSTIYKNSGGM